MLRAILKKQWRDAISGARSEQFETLEFECPELEAKLRSGGFGETGFDMTDLVGVEVLRPRT